MPIIHFTAIEKTYVLLYYIKVTKTVNNVINTMNFCFFRAQYLPTVGGVERYTNSLAKELIKKGHNVTVATSSLAGLPHSETDCDGINIRRLPSVPFMSGRFPAVKPSKELNKFIKDFARDKPDFCVIQTRFYILSLFAAWLCKKHNVPAIVIDHSTSHLMGGGFTGLLGNVYEHAAAYYLTRTVGDFYAVSCRCVKWLSHFDISAVGVLYNSVDLEYINSISLVEKTKYTDTADQLLIVFSARLIAEKGVYKIIDAFNGISSKVNAKLVIAGTGPLEEDIKNKQSDKITVTGVLNYDDVIALYKSADIFCLPTDYPEGFPTAVLESAACKTMLIASDKGGTSEIISDSNYGILLNDTSVDTIQKALLTACTDKEYREKCIENAYAKLSQTFTWDKTCDKLLEIANKKLTREEK